MAVIDEFHHGGDLKVNAFAGAGKTSTLVEIGKSCQRSGLYLSFNKRNADEAAQKFPTHVKCKTTHALALATVRGRFQNRDKLFNPINAPLIEQSLDVNDINGEGYNFKKRQIASLTSTMLRTWLYSPQESFDNVQLPEIGVVARLLPSAREAILEVTRELLARCWSKMIDPAEPLPLTHDGYVKYWALQNPRINADFILLDEAQDSNPIILDVLSKQQCQKVFVGDRHQQIYEWRGAVNAMSAITTASELNLTQSFRFGNGIASLANQILKRLNEKMPLKGNPGIESRIGATTAQAVLARTNGKLIEKLLVLLSQRKRVYVQGGTDEQKRLLKGISAIRSGETTDVPELFGIRSWDELKQFVETDDGQAMSVLIRLVETIGLQTLFDALNAATADEANCDVLLSTLHKAKGLEWNRVELLDDFVPPSDPRKKDAPVLVSDEQLRIMYVAVTRAKDELQVPQNMLSFLNTDGQPSATSHSHRTWPHNADTPAQEDGRTSGKEKLELATSTPRDATPKPTSSSQELPSQLDAEPIKSPAHSKPLETKEKQPQGCLLVLVMFSLFVPGIALCCLLCK